jgi:hypothetical protein
MNVELEASLKVKVNDETPDPRVETRKPAMDLPWVVSKIASHPCVALIVREIMKRS